MIESDVKVTGDVRIGVAETRLNLTNFRSVAKVSICGPSELTGHWSAPLRLGEDCDIASFVVINVNDSSRRCAGKSTDIERGEIIIGDHTFIGTGTVIIGPCRIGSRVRVGAKCFIKGCDIPDDAVILPGASILNGVHVYHEDYSADNNVTRWP